MFQRYNIEDYITKMDVQMMDTSYCRHERKRFPQLRSELKSTIYRYYFFNGYFDGINLSDYDLKAILGGCSPVRGKGKNESLLFTVHHIQPLICGGETVPSNLIPIPQRFHDFIHKAIFEPQTDGMQLGDQKTIIGVPDFSKITLPMMMDSSFIIQYHKHLVDNYGIIPIPLKIGKERNVSFTHWYQHNFGKNH